MLIQGASSGVGLMGMQIAKLMGAKLVLGSSTNAERRARLGEFGCDVAIDTSDPAWPDRVLEATGGRGVELIVDQVSAPVANGNLRACAILGRIVNVGRLGGARGEFDYDLHAMRRISYIGVTFRTRSLDEVREINRRMRADLWEAVEAGKLRLPHRPDLPAGGGGGGAGAHEGEPALREGGAGDVIASASAPQPERHLAAPDIEAGRRPAPRCRPSPSHPAARPRPARRASVVQRMAEYSKGASRVASPRR